MKRLLERNGVANVSRVVLAIVFIVYGASKIPHTAEFSGSIHNYHLVPVSFENLMAMTLPWIEVAAGFALLTRRWLPGGALVIGVLTVVFTGAIVSALARGLDINCGCFTLTDKSPTRNNLHQHLVLDIILIALSVHVWWWAARRNASERAPEGS